MVEFLQLSPFNCKCEGFLPSLAVPYVSAGVGTELFVPPGLREEFDTLATTDFWVDGIFEVHEGSPTYLQPYNLAVSNPVPSKGFVGEV